MQPEQQERIMGYFIEEAKDHLNTIEQGLLNLQSTIEDSELLYEVYRAAHSVKGGRPCSASTAFKKPPTASKIVSKPWKRSPNGGRCK
jgi:chemotaxis protein histidine kinase CheA